MSERGMEIPLMVGGATTSALHTAVKLAPLYGHVFHGADASAAAVMAKKCVIDRQTFEEEQHREQEKIRALYNREDIATSAAPPRNDIKKAKQGCLIRQPCFILAYGLIKDYS